MGIDAVISVLLVQDEVKSFRVVAGLVSSHCWAVGLNFAISILFILCVVVVAEELVWCL